MKKFINHVVFLSCSLTLSKAQAINYIVKFKKTSTLNTLSAQNILPGDTEVIPKLNLAIVNSKTAKVLTENKYEIDYIEPDFPVQTAQATNDPKFEGHLQNFGLPSVWAKVKGSANVVVAVIDTGIALAHEDLKNQIWINQNEIPNNNIDDDNNGFIDDIQGWNFYANKNNANDDNNHGSHVAGIIGAQGNNKIGTAGVAYGVRLMPIKVLGKEGSGTTSNTIKGIIYAADNGAHIINASFGSYTYTTAQKDAIEYARSKNVLFVAAAGNDKRNNDKKAFYPASYDLDNLISVAATDRNKRLAKFSNYGLKTVDIGAPGVNIRSCSKSSYTYLSGTSMAAPHVAGAAALLMSENPNIGYQEVKRRIFLGSGTQDRERLSQGGYLDLEQVF